MPTNADRGRIYGDKLLVRVSSVPHPDNFDGNDGDASKLEANSNSARYYLHGAHFEKV